MVVSHQEQTLGRSLMELPLLRPISVKYYLFIYFFFQFLLDNFCLPTKYWDIDTCLTRDSSTIRKAVLTPLILMLQNSSSLTHVAFIPVSSLADPWIQATVQCGSSSLKPFTFRCQIIFFSIFYVIFNTQLLRHSLVLLVLLCALHCVRTSSRPRGIFMIWTLKSMTGEACQTVQPFQVLSETS
jgi:hypothetical protein